MMRQISDIQPGDEVVILQSSNYPDRLYLFETVACLTKTQIVMANGSRYMKRTGRKAGSDEWHYNEIATHWNPTRLVTVKEARASNAKIEQENNRKALARRLSVDVVMRDLPLGLLQAIEALVDDISEHEEPGLGVE